MDANLSFKPAVAAFSPDVARPPPAVSTTRTELPAEKTVTPVAKSAATGGNPAQAERPTRGVVLIDAASRQVIYRVLDANSRRVVWQEPDDATLRLRAYARAAEPKARRFPSPNTDLEA